MLSAFTNCFKIPELRQRILLTLGLVFIARVGAGIPLPGVDPTPLQNYYASAASDAGSVFRMAPNSAKISISPRLISLVSSSVRFLDFFSYS